MFYILFFLFNVLIFQSYYTFLLFQSEYHYKLTSHPAVITSFNLKPLNLTILFAKKKSGGVTNNGRDSQPKALGFKVNIGERVTPGMIIKTQRGQKHKSGTGTILSRTHSIQSISSGFVVCKKGTISVEDRMDSLLYLELVTRSWLGYKDTFLYRY